jgi:uncharacterized delta-60 repeat protein
MALVVALLAGLLIGPAAANAAEGDLDETFNPNGTIPGVLIQDPTAGDSDYITAIKPLDNGNILMSGWTIGATYSFAFTMVDDAGEAVNDFGTGGVAQHYVDENITHENLEAELQSDGKIVACGYADLNADNGYDGLLVRIDSSGDLDTSFGNQSNGWTHVNNTDDPALDVTFKHMIALEDDSIVVAGEWDNSTRNQMLIAKFTKDGELDTGFGGGDGYAMADPEHGGTNICFGLARTPDNGFVLAGNPGFIEGPDYPRKLTLIKFTSDGTLDTGFGTSGWASLEPSDTRDNSRGLDVAVTEGGDLYVVGSYTDHATNNTEGVVAKFDATGSLDTTYGTNGAVYFKPDTGYEGEAFALECLLGYDGRLYVLFFNEDSSAWDQQIVACFDSDGGLDPDFGDNGYTVNLQADSINVVLDERTAMAADTGGNILGGARYWDSDYDFHVARYEAQAVAPPAAGDPAPVAGSSSSSGCMAGSGAFPAAFAALAVVLAAWRRVCC